MCLSLAEDAPGCSMRRGGWARGEAPSSPHRGDGDARRFTRIAILDAVPGCPGQPAVGVADIAQVGAKGRAEERRRDEGEGKRQTALLTYRASVKLRQSSASPLLRAGKAEAATARRARRRLYLNPVANGQSSGQTRGDSLSTWQQREGTQGSTARLHDCTMHYSQLALLAQRSTPPVQVPV